MQVPELIRFLILFPVPPRSTEPPISALDLLCCSVFVLIKANNSLHHLSDSTLTWLYSGCLPHSFLCLYKSSQHTPSQPLSWHASHGFVIALNVSVSSHLFIFASCVYCNHLFIVLRDTVRDCHEFLDFLVIFFLSNPIFLSSMSIINSIQSTFVQIPAPVPETLGK